MGKLASWNMFLGGKTKQQRKLYIERRECARCGAPILDRNKSGFCRKCQRKWGKLRLTESKYHIALKKRGMEYLESLGCTDIKMEVELNSSRLRFDVVGMLDGQMIAIECGSSKRLKERSYLVDKLYILPYGENIPFLWDKSIKLCSSCGRRMP